MKRLSLWGFIFVALFGQVAFAKDQLKCSLIDSDDLLARENITLFTNDKKPGDPSFKIITIKLEEEALTNDFTLEVETFSNCSTDNEGVKLRLKLTHYLHLILTHLVRSSITHFVVFLPVISSR